MTIRLQRLYYIGMTAHCILKNEYMELELTANGAAMRRLTLADGTEPLLSLAGEDAYLSDPSYDGTIVGPACGRIKNGELRIGSETFLLAKNEPQNTLHGGPHGTARSVWNLRQPYKGTAVFDITLKDGLDGFPGRRRIETEYRLSGRSVYVTITAATDKPTLFNPTIHSYWNLHQEKSARAADGIFADKTSSCITPAALQHTRLFTPTGTAAEGVPPENISNPLNALDHTLLIPAETVYLHDEQVHAVKQVRVTDYPAFDFTKPVTLAGAMTRAKQGEQPLDNHGYDHPFHASLANLICGSHALTLITDAPDIWLYSGRFLDTHTMLRHTAPADRIGSDYSAPAFPYCGIALEPQDIEPQITEPGTVFKRNFQFSFDC